MVNDVVTFVFAVVALVLGSGAETLLPKFLGVGFPVLLTMVQFMAARRTAAAAVVFALAAGAMEDALSALPAATSASFFLLLAALVRWAGMPRAATLLTYPAYQAWIYVWTDRAGGGVFSRVLLALPVGLATALVVGAVMVWAEREAAVDEKG